MKDPDIKTTRVSTILSFLTVLIIALAVFLVNMTFASRLPANLLMYIRIALIVVFSILWRVLSRHKRTHAGTLAFTMMAVNLAFFIVSFFTAGLWGLNLGTAGGIALAKLSDSFIISFVLILSFVLGGFPLKNIFLARGRFTAGLVIGICSFILMASLAVTNPSQHTEPGFLRRNLAWIFLFVLSNGFMEELLFRGIFLKHLNNLLKPVWTIILTSVVFAAAHLQVTYTPDVLIFTGIVLILGMIWGFLMHYTQSILASMLFHAGADLMIIIPIFSSFGVGG
jgi:membrane protease YdiL (CAAX protease family)